MLFDIRITDFFLIRAMFVYFVNLVMYNLAIYYDINITRIRNRQIVEFPFKSDIISPIILNCFSNVIAG